MYKKLNSIFFLILHIYVGNTWYKNNNKSNVSDLREIFTVYLFLKPYILNRDVVSKFFV